MLLFFFGVRGVCSTLEAMTYLFLYYTCMGEKCYLDLVDEHLQDWNKFFKPHTFIAAVKKVVLGFFIFQS